MSFPIEDFERIPELDKMWLLEKEEQMFVEWQQWEDEQDQLPAIITMEMPKFERDEVEFDSFPF